METKKETEQAPQNPSRRDFIQNGGLLIASAGVAGLSGLVISCTDQNDSKEKKEEEEEEVSANEDLMREHGLLNRMLLIYDTAIARMIGKEEFNPDYINRTANIIRNFVEDYHEKLEEDYLFPRLEKANTLTDLTATLRKQHQAGRSITEQLLSFTKGRSIDETNSKKIIELLQVFNRMYRPHEAREDTILFPEFKKIVSRNEYDSLGEDFERKEHEKFGGDGFDMMVDKVSEIEKQIGIYELEQFTPKPDMKITAQQ